MLWIAKILLAFVIRILYHSSVLYGSSNMDKAQNSLESFIINPGFQLLEQQLQVFESKNKVKQKLEYFIIWSERSERKERHSIMKHFSLLFLRLTTFLGAALKEMSILFERFPTFLEATLKEVGILFERFSTFLGATLKEMHILFERFTTFL